MVLGTGVIPSSKTRLERMFEKASIELGVYK